ncbi:MAG: hypothetical protein F6K19_24670 [Cyanothece sp. SIO1E1]|nr:hypothetical protein [Cyanothece sp. SIO1E1]
MVKDAPSLRILAGLNPELEREQVQPYFQKACQEMGLISPDTPKAIADYIYWLAENCISGTEPAIKTISVLGSLYYQGLVDVPMLQVWHALNDAIACFDSPELEAYIDDYYPGVRPHNLSRIAKQEARLLLAYRSISLPETIMSYAVCRYCGYFGPTSSQPFVKLANWLFRLRYGYNRPMVCICTQCGATDLAPFSNRQVRIRYLRQLQQSQTGENQKSQSAEGD